MRFSADAVVEIKGFDELLAKLDNITRRIRNDILRDALNETGTWIAGLMKAGCPVDTGTLRKSLGRLTRKYHNGAVWVLVIGPNRSVVKPIGVRATRYAHMVENGTVKMKAQPFMRPAWGIARPQVEQKLATAIWVRIPI